MNEVHGVTIDCDGRATVTEAAFESRRQERRIERRRNRVARCMKAEGIANRHRDRVAQVAMFMDERTEVAPTTGVPGLYSVEQYAAFYAGRYRQMYGIGPVTWWWIGKMVLQVILWWLMNQEEAD